MLTDGTSSFSTDKVAKAQPFHRPKNDFTGHRSITFKIRQHFGSQCQVNSRGQGKSIQPHRGRKSADIRTGVQRWPTHDWPCVFGISSLFGVHSAATRCSLCRYSVTGALTPRWFWISNSVPHRVSIPRPLKTTKRGCVAPQQRQKHFAAGFARSKDFAMLIVPPPRF